MDAIALARWQFGITTVYHFFFVPLTLGLVWVVAIMQTMYAVGGNPVYKSMAKFWGKLFLINFAMGVVTGIVQEFQFGMNWSEYSRFVGDIFGAPLAIEALLAFFMESVFLGVWLFGEGKLNKWLHTASIWLVAVGANISAAWILIANSFMQQPVGYTLNNGRAEMTDFFALVLNPNFLVMFPHVLSGGLATAGFFVLGIAAWHLRRGSDVEIFRRSFAMGAIFALVATVLVILNGHSQAQHMVQVQPMKMAAAEGLYQTEDPASFSLLTIGNLEGTQELFSIRIPGMLSFLSYNRFSGAVEGIDPLQQQYEAKYGPGDYSPPPAVIYWSFRIMIGAGMLMLVLSLYALFLYLGDLLGVNPKLLWVFLPALLLPYIANTAGWIMTEVGRFPWIVYGLQTMAKGVSTTVPAPWVLLTLVGFTLVYGFLMVITIGLMMKYARQPVLSTNVPDVVTPLPSLVGAD